MSLLLLLVDSGIAVFPPLPPSLPSRALPAGGGGVRRRDAANARIAAAPDLRAPASPRARLPQGPREC